MAGMALGFRLFQSLLKRSDIRPLRRPGPFNHPRGARKPASNSAFHQSRRRPAGRAESNSTAPTRVSNAVSVASRPGCAASIRCTPVADSSSGASGIRAMQVQRGCLHRGWAPWELAQRLAAHPLQGRQAGEDSALPSADGGGVEDTATA